VGGADGGGVRDMSARDDVELVRRLYAAINARDEVALERIFAPDVARHDLTDMVASSDRSGAVRGFLQSLREAMPDLHMELDDVFADGAGRAVARVTLTGTHEAPFLGVEPHGRRVTFAAISMYRIEGGCIAEVWSLVDWAGAVRQMGGPR
jgi:steroid delta-isomerase-like uncharacterized protein